MKGGGHLARAPLASKASSNARTASSAFPSRRSKAPSARPTPACCGVALPVTLRLYQHCAPTLGLSARRPPFPSHTLFPSPPMLSEVSMILERMHHSTSSTDLSYHLLHLPLTLATSPMGFLPVSHTPFLAIPLSAGECSQGGPTSPASSPLVLKRSSACWQRVEVACAHVSTLPLRARMSALTARVRARPSSRARQRVDTGAAEPWLKDRESIRLLQRQTCRTLLLTHQPFQSRIHTHRQPAREAGLA